MKIIAKARNVKCPACQQGKAIMSSSKKKNKIEKYQIIINPGDLIHMDQSESPTPGRPPTHSGKNNNNKNKIFIVSLFVDSISKKVFCDI